MSNEPVRNIDVEITGLKRSIKVRDALHRLEDNPDFKLVFQEELLEKHAYQLVWQRAHPSVAGNEVLLKRIDDKITTIGELRYWLSSVHVMGESADNELVEAEGIRSGVIAEEFDEDL